MLIAKGATDAAKSAFVYDPLGGAVAADLIDVRVGTNLRNIVEITSGIEKGMQALIEDGLATFPFAAEYDPADNSITLAASFVANEDAVQVSVGATAMTATGQSGIFKTTVAKCRDTYLENRDQ